MFVTINITAVNFTEMPELNHALYCIVMHDYSSAVRIDYEKGMKEINKLAASKKLTIEEYPNTYDNKIIYREVTYRSYEEEDA